MTNIRPSLCLHVSVRIFRTTNQKFWFNCWNECQLETQSHLVLMGSKMAKRQFAGFSIQDLEKLFGKKRMNAGTLSSILAELSHRKMSRAKALKRRVLQGLAVCAVSASGGSAEK